MSVQSEKPDNKRILRRHHTADIDLGTIAQDPTSRRHARRTSERFDFREKSLKHAIFHRVRKQSITVAEILNNDNSRRLSSAENLPAVFEVGASFEPVLVNLDKLSLHPGDHESSSKSRASSDRSDSEAEKLDYDEMMPCSPDKIHSTWRTILTHPKREIAIFDPETITQAVHSGVPKKLRAKVWCFLSDQHQRKNFHKGISHPTIPRYNYEQLLKQPSNYDQSILVDITRTFPCHPYFAEQFGPGQIALFNLLKAYAVLDPEVGYCQGLSFITCLLLLHAEEKEAFNLLCRLMFHSGLRRQYLPDMITLQVQMYQLSRLLHLHHPDLYEYFEARDMPTIFSAPWFLTLFGSTFPIGFAARVLDMTFLTGDLEVVFSTCLVLLGGHKELIKNCPDFDAINEFLKTELPAMSIIQMEKIFNEVAEMDLDRDLMAFAIEYEVLQAEEVSSPTGDFMNDHTSRLKAINRNLRYHNKDLLEKLKLARNEVAEARQKTDSLQAELQSSLSGNNSYKVQLSNLKSRLQTSELEYKTLLEAYNRLMKGEPPAVWVPVEPILDRSSSPEGATSSDSGFHDRP